jgi:hypothetical protein
MSTYHLFVASATHVVDIEFFFLLGNATVENHLKEQISQFITELVGVGPIQGFKNLESLFHQQRFQRLTGLLLIPGTAPRSSEGVHQLQ